MANRNWQFWIDRGGTFTDVVALRPNGTIVTGKLLSENPERYEDAAAEIIRRMISSGDVIDAVKIGTTVATNALLERRGAPSVLIVTKGFRDALAIGYQNRPDIFKLNIKKPKPIYARVIEVDERLSATGSVIKSLDENAIKMALKTALDDGFQSAAICLMHAFSYPKHERRIADIAKKAGFKQISVSHEVEPLIKFVSRAETTLVDAYLTPVLNKYIRSLTTQLQSITQPKRLLFMQSNGGLTLAENFRGKNSVLSGPAAGVVGMVETASKVGLKRLIGFDMGGTSTDISAWTGDYERSNDSEVAGVRLRAPMIKVHTIAAGGGSILHYKDQRYQVGPGSAGANPGPACYRRGGPLTITDANVLLGRIPVDSFPKVFGPDANQTLDMDVVRNQFNELAEIIGQDSSARVTAESVAEGFLSVAAESMANAIRKITVERGEDVRDFTLCSFGGAAGQHACKVAEILGIKTVWLHPMAGILSAYGMGLSNIRVDKQQSIESPFSEKTVRAAGHQIHKMKTQIDKSLGDQGVPEIHRNFRRSLGLRVADSDTILDIDYADANAMAGSFSSIYQQRFGIKPDSNNLIIATACVGGTGIEEEFRDSDIKVAAKTAPVSTTRIRLDNKWAEVPVYKRDLLGEGFSVIGPAIIVDANATTVIDAGWTGDVNRKGHLVLKCNTAPLYTSAHYAGQPDPVRLEIFNRLFMHIAEQMGTVLQKTALSVNIRERLDFSCALFDAQGRLVSNAPHMPVHLGSMGESVRSVIAANGNQLGPGDSIMQNSPYNGGTHLPDITVVTPWFEESEKPLFYLASRAHHADIGGITPGSMPSDSQHIDEEGVVIDNFWLVKRGIFQLGAIKALFGSAKYPVRNLPQNIADLKAQLAANQHGIKQLEKAVERYGLLTVQNYLRFVRKNAEQSVRRLVHSLHDSKFQYELDSGETICVKISVDHDAKQATIDFTGSSEQSTSNFNAPEAVTRAATLYVFRSLIDDEIPMNEGCLEPLKIIIPKGSILSPQHPAAVVAGNVETSQCVTDCIYGAVGALAASQGTMNNFTFGNDHIQYYETICGGAGAGPGFDGCDAVHTHMTNSRMTDPEVLEQKFPVILESFSIRQGSGGKGKWIGGAGVTRKIRFTDSVDASILSNHRRIAPFGIGGGKNGGKGYNMIQRSNGKKEHLKGTATIHLEPDDTVIIKTPGGGGYGAQD